jgi:hypothetical protein
MIRGEMQVIQMVWLHELQKNCQFQEVIPIYSLPNQDWEFLYIFDFLVGTFSS